MTDAGEKLRTLEQRYTHWINNDQYDRDDYDVLDFVRAELERAAKIVDEAFEQGEGWTAETLAAAIRRRKD